MTARPRTRKQRESAAKAKEKTLKNKFIKHLHEIGQVKPAAIAAGTTRYKAYVWRNQDEEFAERWDEAIESSTLELEDEAIRRAVHGVEEPIYHAGEQVGTKQRYSDTMLIFLLKARRPEVYRERFEIKHSGGIYSSLTEALTDAIERAQGARTESS